MEIGRQTTDFTTNITDIAFLVKNAYQGVLTIEAFAWLLFEERSKMAGQMLMV